jgi:hypothetical protein
MMGPTGYGSGLARWKDTRISVFSGFSLSLFLFHPPLPPLSFSLIIFFFFVFWAMGERGYPRSGDVAALSDVLVGAGIGLLDDV